MLPRSAAASCCCRSLQLHTTVTLQAKSTAPGRRLVTRSRASHHVIFNASCNCREVVEVAVSFPAEVIGVRLCVNNCRLDAVGGRKFVWLTTLKTSNRNWRLHHSEKHRMRTFRATELSRSTRLGPRATLRPASPSRVEGLGAAKQDRFMYEFGFPGLTGFPQPGRLSRSGKSYAMLLFRPRASPAMTGAKGSPEDTCNTLPICQPSAAVCNAFHPNLGSGNCQVPLMARL